MYTFYEFYDLIKSVINYYLVDFNNPYDKSNNNTFNNINETIKNNINNDIILDKIEIQNNFSEKFKSNKIIEKINKEDTMIELYKIIDLINMEEITIILDSFNYDINKNMDIQLIIDFLQNEKIYIQNTISILQNTLNINFINDIIVRLILLQYVNKKIN